MQNRGRSTAATTRSEIGAGTTTLSDGCILVVGGSLPGIKPSANVLVYDPAADAWAKLAPLPQPWKGAVARQVGDRVIVTTGSPTSVDASSTTSSAAVWGPWTEEALAFGRRASIR